jgi:3-oxoacyl-[acyl-carrier-protein] synthase-3
MSTLKRVGIKGTGMHVPEGVLTNAELERLVDTSDEWITTRTGIKERRKTDGSTASSDLAVVAARKALDEAALKPEEVDLIVVGTVTPDRMFPSTACYVQAGLGAKNAAAFDLSAGCTGFIYTLTTASTFVASGNYRNVLAIGAECLTKIVDFTDRNSCVLFGDGCGAMVLGECTDGRHEIIYQKIYAQGDLDEIMVLPSGGSRMPVSKETLEAKKQFLGIRGREIYKFAVVKMAELIETSARECGITTKDIGLIVPHQVNMRIIEAAMERAGLPMDKVFVNIEKYGNTSAASIPMAFDEAKRLGKIKKGDYVVMVAFGAGLTWGSAVVRW